MTRSDLELALGFGTLAVTLLGLGAVFLQIRVATASQRTDHERQRKQATLDAYSASFSARTSLQERLPNDREFDAVRAFCPDPTDTENDDFLLVVAHLNYWENFATGVHEGVYDIKVVDALAGDRVVGAWKGYEAFILGRRKALRSERVWDGLESWPSTSENSDQKIKVAAVFNAALTTVLSTSFGEAITM